MPLTLPSGRTTERALAFGLVVFVSFTMFGTDLLAGVVVPAAAVRCAPVPDVDRHSVWIGVHGCGVSHRRHSCSRRDECWSRRVQLRPCTATAAGAAGVSGSHVADLDGARCDRPRARQRNTSRQASRTRSWSSESSSAPKNSRTLTISCWNGRLAWKPPIALSSDRRQRCGRSNSRRSISPKTRNRRSRWRCVPSVRSRFRRRNCAWHGTRRRRQPGRRATSWRR